jgi:hypothetical protein
LWFAGQQHGPLLPPFLPLSRPSSLPHGCAPTDVPPRPGGRVQVQDLWIRGLSGRGYPIRGSFRINFDLATCKLCSAHSRWGWRPLAAAPFTISRCVPASSVRAWVLERVRCVPSSPLLLCRRGTSRTIGVPTGGITSTTTLAVSNQLAADIKDALEVLPQFGAGALEVSITPVSAVSDGYEHVRFKVTFVGACEARLGAVRHPRPYLGIRPPPHADAPARILTDSCAAWRCSLTPPHPFPQVPTWAETFPS